MDDDEVHDEAEDHEEAAPSGGQRVEAAWRARGAVFVCEAGCTCGFRAEVGDDLLEAVGLAWAHRGSVEAGVETRGTNWYTTPGHEQWYARFAVLPDGSRHELESGAPARIPEPHERRTRTLTGFGVHAGASVKREVREKPEPAAPLRQKDLFSFG